MSDIFISYASEDRETARALAMALEARGWSVWWDREIPLGESFDNVIERAMGTARCVLVLWSATSAASEWVRSEASEGRRRGILVPIFLEEIEPPLAFRLLNGAPLQDWQPGVPHPEFDRLVRRIAELLGKGPEEAAPIEASPGHGSSALSFKGRQPLWIGASVAVPVLVALGVYLWPRPAPEPQSASDAGITSPAPVTPPASVTAAPSALPDNPFSDLEAALKPLALGLSGTGAGNLALRAFKLPELGMDIAYIGAEQARAMGGIVPAGAVVWAVSAGPAQQADLRAFDVIVSIDRKAIASDEDLRRLLRALGPGKHTLRIKREGREFFVTVDCPDCRVS